MPKKPQEPPQAFWSGTITFGLVSVPVQLFPAHRSGDVRWRMLDEDGTPLHRRFFCPADDRELATDEMVRGYEIGENEYVVVTDEELEKLDPRKSRDIDLQSFVNEDELDPLYFERSYFLVPAYDSNKAYRLLADAMAKKRQAGIGTFVMRDKEYVIAIVSQGGILRAETLRFADEIRSPREVGLSKIPPADQKRIDQISREMGKITTTKLRPETLRNEYADQVRKLIARKLKSHQSTVKVGVVEVDEPEERSAAGLVELLRQSLTTGSSARVRKQHGKRPARQSPVRGAVRRSRTIRGARRRSA